MTTLIISLKTLSQHALKRWKEILIYYIKDKTEWYITLTHYLDVSIWCRQFVRDRFTCLDNGCNVFKCYCIISSRGYRLSPELKPAVASCHEHITYTTLLLKWDANDASNFWNITLLEYITQLGAAKYILLLLQQLDFHHYSLWQRNRNSCTI